MIFDLIRETIIPLCHKSQIFHKNSYGFCCVILLKHNQNSSSIVHGIVERKDVKYIVGFPPFNVIK